MKRPLLLSGAILFAVLWGCDQKITGDPPPGDGDSHPYWNTVHYEVWGKGDITPAEVPWEYITHLINFSGQTGGSLTNATPPYFEPSTDWDETGWGAELRQYGLLYGVKILMDLGFNQGNEFTDVEAAGGISTWADTVAQYMVKWGYDGADFDLEGGGYANIADFAKALKDRLAELNPGKTYVLTTSIMSNVSDVQGWHVPEAVAQGLLDQVNPMWYDYCFPIVSNLYQSSTHDCFGSDSEVADAFAGTGIPKNKIGLGYAIQVYSDVGGFYQIFQNVIDLYDGATVFWDDEAKSSWFTNGTRTIAYGGVESGWYKADFIKKNGYGGAMGFCLGRGHLRTPPAGWPNDPAVVGVGANLFGDVPQPPNPS